MSKKANGKRTKSTTSAPGLGELALRLEAETLRARQHLCALLRQAEPSANVDALRELRGIATALHNVDSVASYVRSEARS